MSILSMSDARHYLERALDEPKGLIIICNDRKELVSNRYRFYRVRQNDRKDSKSIYPPEDPAYGTSVFEGIVIREWSDGDRIGLLVINTELTKIEVIDPETGEAI